MPPFKALSLSIYNISSTPLPSRKRKPLDPIVHCNNGIESELAFLVCIFPSRHYHEKAPAPEKSHHHHAHEKASQPPKKAPTPLPGKVPPVHYSVPSKAPSPIEHTNYSHYHQHAPKKAPTPAPEKSHHAPEKAPQPPRKALAPLQGKVPPVHYPIPSKAPSPVEHTNYSHN
ncbi:hypothetical protein GH714_034977 [Hevea brasiliensis]|uniref:Uncharacterized protein n=1 Tax=Hevea brasiliensis TaxID=3981 RepID=A0A6A6LQ32_HEVBR|nr:hypothetical protein GH714_034977 [Hevea brasiliensis]